MGQEVNGGTVGMTSLCIREDCDVTLVFRTDKRTPCLMARCRHGYPEDTALSPGHLQGIIAWCTHTLAEIAAGRVNRVEDDDDEPEGCEDCEQRQDPAFLPSNGSSVPSGCGATGLVDPRYLAAQLRADAEQLERVGCLGTHALELDMSPPPAAVGAIGRTGSGKPTPNYAANEWSGDWLARIAALEHHVERLHDQVFPHSPSIHLGVKP